MNPEDLLLAYSEWLDQTGLIVGDRPTLENPHVDQRSHEQLVTDFLAESRAA